MPHDRIGQASDNLSSFKKRRRRRRQRRSGVSRCVPKEIDCSRLITKKKKTLLHRSLNRIYFLYGKRPLRVKTVSLKRNAALSCCRKASRFSFFFFLFFAHCASAAFHLPPFSSFCLPTDRYCRPLIIRAWNKIAFMVANSINNTPRAVHFKG